MLLLFFLGSAVLFGVTQYSGGMNEETAGPFILAGMVVLLSLTAAFVFRRVRERLRDERQAEEVLRNARNISLARHEVRAKIPKNSPRRESKVTRDGLARLSAVRSMAVLVRKPRLREIVLEICDFADLVLETIRRMPEDTPASVAFTENHLVRLQEALERCFEFYRAKEYKEAAAIDTENYEIECFSAFIGTFCRQQDSILYESHGASEGKHILA